MYPWHVIAAATTADPNGDVISQLLPFLNFGVVGLLVILIATKRVFVPKWTLDDMKETQEQYAQEREDAHEREITQMNAQILNLENDKKELKTANEKLTQLTQDKILPALFEANRLAALQVEVISRRVQGGA